MVFPRGQGSDGWGMEIVVEICWVYDRDGIPVRVVWIPYSLRFAPRQADRRRHSATPRGHRSAAVAPG